MSDSFPWLLGIAAAWAAIGLMLAVVMGRRGHNSFGWLVTGTLLGPLGLVLAIDSWRHDEQWQPAPVPAEAPTPGAGPVDVLIGYDGSPESAAAADAVVALFGDRIGRLTAATVVSYGDLREEGRQAREALRALAARAPGRTFQLEVLAGHPATALATHAGEGGYDVVAIGTRGKGISKAFLGSAATELARSSKVPVLLVGGGPGREVAADVA